MITIRAPLRISLGGGGTDLPAYYEKHEGFVISAAINKYIYVHVNESSTCDKLKLYYDRVEILPAGRLNDIQHDIIRESLKDFNITRPLEIASMADVEAGTGMGSSSSFTVALINALYLLRHEVASRHCIAEHACHIEIDQVGKKIGKQDQYIASYGGIQQLEIFKNGRTEVNPVPLSTEFISELERRFILFYTNIRRPAGLILDSQTDNIRKKDSQVSDRMHRIKEMGHEIKFALQSENIDDIGYIFHEHWQEKRQISPDMSSSGIDSWYEWGLKHGAIGGKVVGAGGGGFILFVAKEDKRKELIHTMANAGMRFMDFRFDFDGVKIMTNL